MQSGRRERVEQANIEDLEIRDIAGHDRQVVNLGGSGDQRIFDQMLLPAMHKLCPLPEDRAVRRQDIVGAGDLIEPRLDFGRLGCILFTRDFDPGLNLGKGHGTKVQILIGDFPEPREHSAMGTWPAQFRDDVGIEQEHRSGKADRRPATSMSPGGKFQIGARRVGQEKLFQRRLRGVLQPPPFTDRDKDSSLVAPSCHKLWPLAQAGGEQLAESRLGVLDRPDVHSHAPFL